MNNYKDAAEGKRIRLLGEMINNDSSWMPKEDLPVGLEGTITYVSINGSKLDQIGVDWDNGRSLGILPYNDKYEIIN
jgi:hypothetical protein